MSMTRRSACSGRRGSAKRASHQRNMTSTELANDVYRAIVARLAQGGQAHVRYAVEKQPGRRPAGIGNRRAGAAAG